MKDVETYLKSLSIMRLQAIINDKQEQKYIKTWAVDIYLEKTKKKLES